MVGARLRKLWDVAHKLQVGRERGPPTPQLHLVDAPCRELAVTCAQRRPCTAVTSQHTQLLLLGVLHPAAYTHLMYVLGGIFI